MRLSTKLKISFGCLIILPMLLVALAVMGISQININHMKEQYNVEGLSYDNLINPIQLVNMICEKEYNEIKNVVRDDPGKVHNKEYMDRISESLSKRNVFLLVVEQKKPVYQSFPFKDNLIEAIISSNYNNNVLQGLYLMSHNVFLNTIPYVTDGGVSGNVYMVVKMSGFSPQIKRILIDSLISIIVILILTSGFFISWIYRSTMKPIRKLRLATNNIKNQNLDFEIDVNGSYEFAELCKDFDNMRKRLKFVAEDKVRRDAEYKELVSNITHDLKTPITTIKGYVEGIMDGVADTEEKKNKYIRTIYSKACELDNLINELAFYSKVNADKLNYNFCKINISGYFSDCVEELITELDNDNIKLIYNCNVPDDTYVVIDPEQFKKVINNIISNSVKYMDVDNGIITIDISEDEKDIFINISDNGKGIDKKDIEHIFDRFYRADRARGNANGGSGIGLSIVKKIINDHGGSISAQSTPGVETVMKIVLDKYTEPEEE